MPGKRASDPLGRDTSGDQHQTDNESRRQNRAHQHKGNDTFLLKISLAVLVTLYANESRQSAQKDVKPRGPFWRF